MHKHLHYETHLGHKIILIQKLTAGEGKDPHRAIDKISPKSETMPKRIDVEKKNDISF